MFALINASGERKNLRSGDLVALREDPGGIYFYSQELLGDVGNPSAHQLFVASDAMPLVQQGIHPDRGMASLATGLLNGDWFRPLQYPVVLRLVSVFSGLAFQILDDKHSVVSAHFNGKQVGRQRFWFYRAI